MLVHFVLSASMGFAAEQFSDTDKRQMIENLYLNYRTRFPEAGDIDPQIALELASEKNVIFIDTRKQKEQRVSMLPGAITAKTFLENTDKYKHHLKIVYCTIGYRSGMLAQKLSKSGNTVLNLRGGILGWVHAGGRVYEQNGQTDRIHVYGRRWNLAPESYETIW